MEIKEVAVLGQNDEFFHPNILLTSQYFSNELIVKGATTKTLMIQAKS